MQSKTSGDFDDRERPGDTLIEVHSSLDETLVKIPARPLNFPLKILLALNIGSIVFLLVVGVAYLVFRVSLFTGLPEPHAVFTGHHAENRWLIEVAIGWLAALCVIVSILGMVWIPQIADESLTLSAHGLAWSRQGWWRHEHLDAAWSEVNDIVLLGNLQEIVTNRLAIQLFTGNEQTIAESTSNREREWLEHVLRHAAARYRGL